MGGGQQSSGTSKSGVFIPPFEAAGLKGTITKALGQEQAAQGALPSISQLFGQIPLQGVAPLTPTQLGLIGQYQQVPTGPNAPEQAGLSTLGEYASGPIGQDPATLAALQQFQQLTSPALASQSAMQGTGNSGAALEAQALGRSQALTPLLQQAEQQQLAAGGELFGAGQGLNQQALSTLSAQLQAAGMPQAEAQQVANALFAQQQQRFQYASGVQQAPLGLIPNTLGQTSTQNLTQGTTK